MAGKSKIVAPKLLRASKASQLPSPRPMTGNGYRDLIASYIHHNYASEGLVVYVEISLGKIYLGQEHLCDVLERCRAVSEYLVDRAPVWLDDM